MDVFGFLAGLNQQPCGTADGNETADAACARFALTQLIQEHFVAVYADANDIKVTDTQVQQTVTQLDDSLGKKAVDDQLTAHDLTRTDLSDLARRILLFGEVQRAVAADTITDAQLRQQYQDGIANYTTVQVDHILVKTKAEAQDVYAQVTAPGATEQDFLALAKQVSTDPSVKQNSGSLGSAVAATYTPAFAAAVLKMEPGEISKPVHTDFGWHVILMVHQGRAVLRFGEAAAARRRLLHRLQRLAEGTGRERHRRHQPEVRTVRRRHAGGLAHLEHRDRYYFAVGEPLRVSEGLTHVPEGPVPASQGGARLLELIRVQARLRAPAGARGTPSRRIRRSPAICSKRPTSCSRRSTPGTPTRSGTSSATCCCRSRSTRRSRRTTGGGTWTTSRRVWSRS